MNHFYNGLPFEAPRADIEGDWMAYFDVEYRILDDEIILVDHSLSGLSIVHGGEEEPLGPDYASAPLKAQLHRRFEDAFNEGRFHEELREAANEWDEY